MLRPSFVRLVPVSALALSAPPLLAQQCTEWAWLQSKLHTQVQPVGVAAGDLDGDGWNDLVVASFGSTTLQTFLNQGDETFVGGPHPGGFQLPAQVAVLDVDGDGDQDVLAAYNGPNYTGGGVAVMHNDGHASFGAPVKHLFTAGDGVVLGMEVRDVDGDGVADAVVALQHSHLGGSSIAVFLGDGIGGFGPVHDSATLSTPRGMVVDDLDGDGLLDCAVISSPTTSSVIAVAFGNGDGSFGTPVTYSSGLYGSILAGGDFDGDGDVDLISGDKYALRFYQNDGTGTFAQIGNDQTFGNYPKAVDVGDLDLDGDLDLMVSYPKYPTGYVSMLLNDGGWSFHAAASYPTPDYATDATLAHLTDGPRLDWAGVMPATDWLVLEIGRCMLGTYCQAKVNSQGCLPAISWTGVPTRTGADDFVITADQELNRRPGLLLFGYAPESLPFYGGTLCVAPPLVRGPVQDSGGNPPPDDCTGSYAFPFTHQTMAQHGLVAGDQVFGQIWSRDPHHADGTSVALTDGLRFTIKP